MTRRATAIVILVCALGLAAPAAAELGFGLEVAGGSTVINNSRLYNEQDQVEKNFEHGAGLGWYAAPQILIGYRTDAFFAGGEVGYMWDEATIEYDDFGGEEDYEVRRRADTMRVGGVFAYYFSKGKIRPFIQTGLAFYVTQASLRDTGDYNDVLVRFDTGYGAGLTAAFGASFEVKDNLNVEFGLRVDGMLSQIRRYKNRLVDEIVQVPVGLFARVMWDLDF